jgi:hypothetical protein
MVVALSLLSIEGALVQAAVTIGAEDLTAEGVRLRRNGKDQEALPLFEEAVRQKPTPRALAQLGFCEQALGLWVAAELHIQSALQDDRDPWIRKNEAALRESLNIVQGKLGSIEIWGTPVGARILLDNQPVANLPTKQPIRVPEGRHLLTIEARDFLSETRVLNVRALALTREHVALAATVRAVTQPLPPPTLPSGTDTTPGTEASGAAQGDMPVSSSKSDLPLWRRALPWSLLAGAIVGGSVAVWQQAVWYDGLNRFDAIPACGLADAGKGSDIRCQGIFDDFSRARVRTFVGYGVAGLLGATAATLFVLNATTRDDTSVGALEFELEPGRTALAFVAAF